MSRRWTKQAWLRLLDRLRATGLVAPASSHAPDEVDAHPLVREHFGAELRAEASRGLAGGARAAVRALQGLPEKEQPDTLEEMAPLFQAVFHGCQAGRHQEALDEVYWARIIRAITSTTSPRSSARLAPIWRRSPASSIRRGSSPVASITEAHQAFMLSQAGFRPARAWAAEEAVAPMRASLDDVRCQEDWMHAAIGAGNLSELQLTLGEVAEAIALAEQSVDYADRSGDAFRRMANAHDPGRCAASGGRARAGGSTFQEAERLQAERQPEYPRLYSLQGYRYCDLLLDLGRHAEVRDRATQTYRDGATGDNSLLDIALDHLSLGRAELLAHEADGSGNLAEAERQLNQAVDGLRKAGTIQIFRAACWPGRRISGSPSNTTAPGAIWTRRCASPPAPACGSTNATRIWNTPGSSWRKEIARLPARHLTRAAELVAATGYHRRDKDLEELKAALG